MFSFVTTVFIAFKCSTAHHHEDETSSCTINAAKYFLFEVETIKMKRINQLSIFLHPLMIIGEKTMMTSSSYYCYIFQTNATSVESSPVCETRIDTMFTSGYLESIADNASFTFLAWSCVRYVTQFRSTTGTFTQPACSSAPDGLTCCRSLRQAPPIGRRETCTRRPVLCTARLDLRSY
jgi:hypothetical protein